MTSSGPEQEVPAADEEVPAGPQPQREQRPPPDGVTHDHAKDVAEGRDAGHPGQGEPLPRENGAEKDHPDEVTDERMPCHANLPATDSSSGQVRRSPAADRQDDAAAPDVAPIVVEVAGGVIQGRR